VDRTYRIHRFQTVYLTVFSVVWFGAIVGIALYNFPDRWTGNSIYGAVFAGVVALLPAIATALAPRSVTVSGDGTCTFRSLVRSRTVRAQQIRPITYDEGDIELRHDRGKITMKVTHDFEDFLAQLRELNPWIELPRAWAEQLDNRGARH
jgi:hypothetical protein